MPTANVNWNGQTYRINFDRKLTDTELYNYMQQNYPKQTTQQTETETETPKQLKTTKEFANETLKPVAEKGYNFLRSVGQGATLGQGSHLAGLGRAIGSTAYNVLNGEKALENFADEYKKGREEFKKEYKDFSDQNKALSIGGELVGGLGTGLGSGALKALSLAKNPLVKSALSGGGIGALYGASNTEGKGIDLKNAALGAGLGAGAGAVLPLVATKVLQGYNKLGTLGKLYSKGFDKTSKAINPVKEVLDDEGKVLQGKVSAYVRPSGTQNKTARLFAENEYIRKEAAKGDVGLRFEEYGNEAVKDLSNLKNIVKQAESNAYKQAGITDDYIIDLSKSNILDDLINASKNYNDEIALFAKSTKADTNLGNDLLTDLQIATVANGNKISFGNLKRITNKLYNDKQKAYKDFGGGSAEYKLLSDYYKIFSNLKYQDKNLAEATAKFAKLEQAIDKFEQTTGINLEKSKNFAAKIFQGARDRADGGVQEQALEEFTKVMDEFADTKALKDISNKMKMAQFAYDLRPTNIDSKFARDVAQKATKGDTLIGFGKDIFNRVAFGKEYSPQEFYQILAQRIKQGKIKPADITNSFNRIKVPLLNDIEANRLYLQNKLLGTSKAGMIGKIIEQFYK